MQRPLLLNDDQVYRLLQTAFNTEAVQTLEKAVINEAVRAVTKAAEKANGTQASGDIPAAQANLG